MSEWYYADAAQQRHGPMPADELQQRFQRGEVGLTTLVWRDGLSEWHPLADFVDELGLTQAPAALPPSDPAEAPPAPPAQALPAAWTSPDTGAAVHSPYAAPAATLGEEPRFVAGGEVVQAGFWKRTAAYLIDGMLVGMVAQVIQFAIMLAFFGFSSLGGSPDFSTPGGIIMLVLVYLVPLAMSALYFGLFHASTKQATLGKMAVGIKVVRTDGSRISVGRGIGRYFGFLLSSLTIFIGFLMAAFTERKQALHDMLCDTLVVDKWAYTDHPEWQQRKLGTVTVVILSLFGVLMVGVLLVVLLLIGVAASGDWH
ncbi:RDD family protein [Xanthomonas sp. NCPPB 2654]|uniref:RDD family protein n=1 Tax=unclassified Xanthomonas TaxID=2643310 RepID=UPI0021DF9DED|nr:MULTISPECIES: RDD family protein [unclassified Xanthomonas]MDL5367905.1 RDD family protein [Xanthomonas sp. NCPPB 2654]MDR6672105.1 putative RDD family membrane protein YckC [Xanthomonas translucens]UYC20226.1 RDD family protein [Xanthomonas sp. CFBP 8443]